MIDLNSITISEEKFKNGDIELKAGIVVTCVQHISHNDPDIKSTTEYKKLKIRHELFKRIYGDLAEPINELKSLVKEYLLEPTETGYSYHPYFLNSARTQELIDKLDDLLKMPE